MENMENNDIILVILGSVLAMMTSFFLELFKNYSEDQRLIKNFKTIISLELKHFISIADQLSEDYSRNKFFLYPSIEQLNTNLKRLEDIRKNTIFLKDIKKKEEILKHINELSVFSSDIKGIEDYEFTYSKEKEETEEAKKNRLRYCADKRQTFLFKIIDLKRKAEEIITYCDDK